MKSKSGKNEPLATKAAVTEKAREGRLSFASNTGFLMTCTALAGAAGTANQWMSLGTGSATGIISASAEP